MSLLNNVFDISHWSGSSYKSYPKAYLTDSDITTLENHIQLNMVTEITDRSTVYFTPGHGIPIYKFNEWKNSNTDKKVKRCIKPSKATIVVIGNEYISSVVESDKYVANIHKIIKADVKYNAYSNSSMSYGCSAAKKVVRSNINVAITELSKVNKQLGKKILVDNYQVIRFVANSSYYSYNPNSNVELKQAEGLVGVIDLVKSTKSPIKFILEQDVLNQINDSDYGALDYEQYLTIQSMLRSTDRDNVELGMELMCNCDYSQSIAYLVLLCMDAKNKLGDYKFYKSRNFTSLLAYMTEIHSRLIYISMNTRSLIDVFKELSKKDVLKNDEEKVMFQTLILRNVIRELASTVKSNNLKLLELKVGLGDTVVSLEEA